MGAYSSTIVTSTCFSCGRTSRNHPTHPTMTNIVPSRLTEALVTRPANNNVTPKARTIGQAVGAGSVTDCAWGASAGIPARAILIFLPLASDDVDDGEHNYPDHVDKVPVQRKDV